MGCASGLRCVRERFCTPPAVVAGSGLPAWSSEKRRSSDGHNESCVCLSLGMFAGLQDASEERDPNRPIHARYQDESRNVKLPTSEPRQKFFGHWVAVFDTAARRQPNTPAVRLAKDEMCVFLCALDRHREAYALREVLLAESLSNLERGGHLTQMGHTACSIALTESNKEFAQKAIDAFAKVREMYKERPDVGWYGLQQEALLYSAVFDDHGKAAEAYAESLSRSWQIRCKAAMTP